MWGTMPLLLKGIPYLGGSLPPRLGWGSGWGLVSASPVPSRCMMHLFCLLLCDLSSSRAFSEENFSDIAVKLLCSWKKVSSLSSYTAIFKPLPLIWSDFLTRNFKFHLPPSSFSSILSLYCLCCFLCHVILYLFVYMFLSTLDREILEAMNFSSIFVPTTLSRASGVY